MNLSNQQTKTSLSWGRDHCGVLGPVASGGQFDRQGNEIFRGKSAYIGVREATDLQEKRHTDDVRLTNISERVRPRTDHVCDVPTCRRTGARDVQSRAHRSHALDDALKALSVLRNRLLFELFRSSRCWSRIGARSIARRFCRRHFNLCKRGHSIPVRRDSKISDSDCASGVRLLRGRECTGEQREGTGLMSL